MICLSDYIDAVIFMNHKCLTCLRLPITFTSMASQHNEQSFESDNEVLPLLPEIEDLESLYFNDGSLLLISPEVRTQVHSSVLGRRSTIFHSVWETALNTPFIKTLKVYVTDSKEDLVRYTNAVYNIRRYAFHRVNGYYLKMNDIKTVTMRLNLPFESQC